MAARTRSSAYANELLEIERFPSSPPGAPGRRADEGTTIACGVSCSRELFERAVGARRRARARPPRPLLAQRAARRRSPAARAASRRSSPGTRRSSRTTSRSTPTRRSATTRSSPAGSGRCRSAVRRRRPSAARSSRSASTTLAARSRRCSERPPLVLRGGDGRSGDSPSRPAPPGTTSCRRHEGYDALLTGEPRSRARRPAGSSGSI
jgi:hypothetical protein